MCRTRSSKPELLLAYANTQYKHLDFTGFDSLKQSPKHLSDGISDTYNFRIKTVTTAAER
jgi:hypothetical protein